MSGCYLRISGKDLDGPGLAATLPIPIDASWRRGDPRSANRQHRSGGLRSWVSAKEGSHVAGQIEDALAFLSRYRDALVPLQTRNDIDTILLDFSWDVPVNGNVQWNRWPPALCKLAGELGIAIEATVYIVEARD